jgi:hypothetical protein
LRKKSQRRIHDFRKWRTKQAPGKCQRMRHAFMPTVATLSSRHPKIARASAHKFSLSWIWFWNWKPHAHFSCSREYEFRSKGAMIPI